VTSEADAIAPARPARSGRSITIPQDDKSVASAVRKLAWPIILENLFQTALGTTNMVMVAQLGAASVAGIGTATQLLMILQAGFGAITTGTTVLVARAVGAGDSRMASRVAKQSVCLGALVSVFIAVAGNWGSHWAILALGTEPEVAVLGGAYLRVVTAAALVMVTMFVAGAALRGAGDTRTPMKVTGLINLINVAVSYVLIFGHFGFPALGVVGSAWGATVARTVGSIILLAVLIRGRGPVSIRGREDWRPDLQLATRLWRLGFPTMVEQFLLRGGALAYATIAISLGTVVYATQRITFQVISFSFMPGMGFAQAATTMVGQCLGAGRADMAERSSWYAVRLAVTIMVIAGITEAVMGRQIMTLFTDDPDMIRLGAQALMVIALSEPFQGVGQVLAGSLRGAGDTRFPMLATFTGIWLIRLPLGYLFGVVLGWGLPGIYISNVLDAAGRATVNYLRYRTGRWRTIKV
jgi:putative MATE family efflux protein